MITKTNAAERQLNTAIRLFFENRDHLSSYTLAIASREVTDDVIQSRYSELYRRELARVGDPQKVRLSYRESFKDRIKPEFYKQALNLMNKRQNFLKHADRDPDAEMEELTAHELALTIGFAVSNFGLLTQRWTREMGAFLAWFGAAEPYLVDVSDNHPLSDPVAQIKANMLGDPYDPATLQNMYHAIVTAFA